MNKVKKIPVIIDTDPGIDDFIALMLAAKYENFDIRAITSVCGNLPIEVTTKNALNISKFLGINTIISKGAPKPLCEDLVIADRVHGDNGIAGVELPDTNENLSNEYAWDTIYKEAKKEKGKLVIIALGPLTNIAIAILKYPDLKDYVEKIVIMGGSTTIGNVTPYAEFNIRVDAEAADIVFKSEIPIYMVGLNVTTKEMFTKEEIDEFISLDTKLSPILDKLLYKMYEAYIGFGYNSIAIHDAMTVAYLMDENILKMKEYYVTVETRSRLNYGRTIVDLDNSHRDKEKNAFVAIDVDKQKFKKILENIFLKYKD